MRYSFIFIFLIISIIAPALRANPASIPSQLEQFQKTGSCVGCDLSEANLSWSNHNNANLSSALLVKIYLNYAAVNSSNFSHAQIMYANLRDTQASGSNFSAADLTGADLSYANLSSANLSDANLNNANFTYADLARAVVSEKQLTMVKSLSCTIMPDGTRHKADNGGMC